MDKREGKRTREEQEHVMAMKDPPPAFNACFTLFTHSINFLLTTNTPSLSSLLLHSINISYHLDLISQYSHSINIKVMPCSVRSGFKMVFCIVLLLLSSNIGCANARRLGLHKHHHKIHHKVASLVQDVVNGGGRKRVLGGVETGGEVVVMDYPQPHRKPPIHNEKA
ncbi:BnaA01g17230D [Brassica napus]|uniref:(rape) hypothetical protein n=1 Tax=Brassica napus TaxID=3708 RepID=A0A078H371_BRANA|nr:unnamed protein product [Brassica napus]CDY32261.1 BnaA01g17230D [Brassica napus]